MKIWFDADNSPHVPVMRPIARELERRGHEVVFTARDRASTVELLELYGIPHRVIGGAYPGGVSGKALGTLVRSLALARAGRAMKPDLSFGHGSRALPIASRMIGVPSVTMYDYEWVNPTIFNCFCTRILLPEAIDEGRCREAGIRNDLVRRFPGFKEQIYLADAKPDPALSLELGLRSDRIKILFRPPARKAHYHDPRAEPIMESLLERLLGDPRVQLVFIPRDESDLGRLAGSHAAQIVVPARQVQGPSLILACDAVFGGGGTMTREAAILGVPSCTFFTGREGAVDRALEHAGRLLIFRTREQALGLSLPLDVERRVPWPQNDIVPAVAELILA